MPTTEAKNGSISDVTSQFWELAPDLEREILVGDMGRVFNLESMPSETVRSAWFDTFDWRLYRHDVFLYHDGSDWNFIDRSTNESIRAPCAGPVERRVLLKDLPPCPLKKALEPVIDMRSLQALFVEERTRYTYRFVNADAKTVAYVIIDEHRFQDAGDTYRTVSLQGVRGYKKAYAAVRNFIKEYGKLDPVDAFFFFSRGAQSRGRLPLDYSSKFILELRSEMSSLQAMKIVYSQLLTTIKCNHSGILKDLDTEFLHDFRVAVRRTRSGLGQIKKVLPEPLTADMKAKFAWLGSVTGPTRDLDVYLLYEDMYFARLPECLHGGLQHYFTEMRSRRDVEWRKLARHLRSKKYKQIVTGWEAWLDSADEGDRDAGELAGMPVVDLADGIILRRFKAIIKKGAKINPTSPNTELHRLRIQCKKLRYILEFFASLYPAEEIKSAIRQLRRLQTNLGDFNDLSVQLDILRQYLISMRPGSRKKQEIAAALGGLLTNLYHEHRRVRGKFTKRYREFSSPENRDVYMKLFNPLK